MSLDELASDATADFEWMRAYTLLSRSGYITDAIRACEERWASEFDGNPAAYDCIRKVPGYQEYVRALRSILRFPIMLYRVTTVTRYDAWTSCQYSRPVAATFSRDFADVNKDVFPSDEKLVLGSGLLANPEAVLMRGRVERYELVVDTGHVRPVEVTLLHDERWPKDRL